MILICTGDVCVRSRVSPFTKNVSCISRAGWSGAKFRAEKLCQSSSISGPSAMPNPIPTNIDLISSSVCMSGCFVPLNFLFPGSVRSRLTVGLGFDFKETVFSSNADCARCRNSFSCFPTIGLSTAGTLRRLSNSDATCPLRERNLILNSSSCCSLATAAISASICSRSCAICACIV